ncbi:tether containing UBX domain for GLUT4-like [Teratosphaeria destructans]|uniref:Tether containing UBX domain for GLUT4-like n=1 Tax=Teratosphaeria destructans TaxID=418781 RepID=A0A9W7SMW0_9PEZI|nr:tether containing UBX domain for GLUT4-like [Teratosphaeria destructans]
MSSTVFVVDSSARRTQVKVTPGKFLREILDEACKSKKLNPEHWTLKTQNNKTLDLSQPFRLSGLTPGAKLQLTQASRSTGVVSIALQLPDSEGGGRLVDKFPSSTSLWLVLRKFEEGVAGGQQKLNLTQRGVPSSDSGAGRLLYEQPSLNVGGRTVEGFAELQKTLAQLGLNSGSVVVRLAFRASGQPLEEAMQEISRYFATVETSASEPNATVNGSVLNASAENAAAPPEATGPEPSEDVPMTSDGPTAPIVENDVIASSSEAQPVNETTPAKTINGITVYRPSSSSTPAAALQPFDEATFEPTIDHAKSHQANLQKAGQNKRLLSDKELEEQEEARRAKLSAVQNVTVQVRYPDQNRTEFTVPASESAAQLYKTVQSTLASEEEPFELRYLGNKGHAVLPNSDTHRLVQDFGFRGKVLVTFAWTSEASASARQGSSLKPEFLAHATEIKADLIQQQEVGEANHKEAMAKPESGRENAGKAKGKGDVEAKMKKFLGFGKK